MMKPREGTKEESAQDKLKIMMRLIQCDSILKKLILEALREDLES